ncbi:MAG: hypothetical protein ACNS62_10090 [Candidatus Cyclobacteriaceae bacterium M3_2C_046]
MESKINYSTINQYCQSFTQIICNKFFTGKSQILGHEMLQLTPVKQINLFLIKILFQKWQQEIKQLKSPYFDYDQEEVQRTMADLMNILSRNIRVSREHFEPILQQAVMDSILVIFSPYDYYYKELEAADQAISLKSLKDQVKYIKVNQHLMKSVIDKAEAQQLDQIDQHQGISMLNDVIENTQEIPEDFDNYQQQFAQVLPLDLEQIYSDQKSSDQENELPEQPQSGYSSSDQEGVTLNDRFGKSEGASLVDIHQKSKIDSIKKYISINQRFMFINDLFGGNAEEFNQAVETLEQKTAYDDALTYLQTNFASRNQWDMESEEVNEFMVILAKKFGI